jgi:hypothetical protein
MLIYYSHEDRSYFYIPTFKRYQGNTDREAESDFPAPQDCLTNSRPTRELLTTNSCLDVDVEERKKRSKKPKDEWVIPEELDTPEFRTAWIEWQQHRKEIKKKMTPLAGKRTLIKLNKYTVGTAIRMLNYSIEQGYTGVFEVRGDMSIKKSTKQDLKEKGYNVRS